MEEFELSGFWFVVGKICWLISVACPLLLAAFFCFCLLVAAWQGLAAAVKKLLSAVRRKKKIKNIKKFTKSLQRW